MAIRKSEALPRPNTVAYLAANVERLTETGAFSGQQAARTVFLYLCCHPSGNVPHPDKRPAWTCPVDTPHHEPGVISKATGLTRRTVDRSLDWLESEGFINIERTVTCSNRCRKALSREAKRHRGNNSTYGGSVTPGTDPYVEPSRPETGPFADSRADERFRAQLSRQTVASQPLTEEEVSLLALQRRNPGVLIPQLRDKLLERELERMRQEAAETSQDQPVKVQDPIHNPDPTVVARRAIQSRNANRRCAADPNIAFALRPGQSSGPHPWDDEPQCVDAPWSRGR